jgi:hypothetical protein
MNRTQAPRLREYVATKATEEQLSLMLAHVSANVKDSRGFFAALEAATSNSASSGPTGGAAAASSGADRVALAPRGPLPSDGSSASADMVEADGGLGVLLPPATGDPAAVLPDAAVGAAEPVAANAQAHAAAATAAGLVVAAETTAGVTSVRRRKAKPPPPLEAVEGAFEAAVKEAFQPVEDAKRSLEKVTALQQTAARRLKRRGLKPSAKEKATKLLVSFSSKMRHCVSTDGGGVRRSSSGDVTYSIQQPSAPFKFVFPTTLMPLQNDATTAKNAINCIYDAVASMYGAFHHQAALLTLDIEEACSSAMLSLEEKTARAKALSAKLALLVEETREAYAVSTGREGLIMTPFLSCIWCR